MTTVEERGAVELRRANRRWRPRDLVPPWGSGRGPTAARAAIAVVGVIALWQIYVDVAHPSPLVVVAPSQVWQSLSNDAGDGLLWRALGTSLTQFAYGFLIASALAVPIGLATGMSRKVSAYLEPLFVFLYVTPSVAFAPLLIVALGLGLSSHVAIIGVTVFFPVFWNTNDAVRQVEADLQEVGVAFRSTAAESFLQIALPGAASGIFTGLRFGLASGLVGVVVADFFGSTAGLGFLIFNATQDLDTAQLFEGVIVVAALGLLFTSGLRVLQRRLMPWDRSL